MKKALIVISILIILDTLYFSYLNLSTHISVSYKPFFESLSISGGSLSFAMWLYGFLGGFILCFSKVIDLNSKLKKQKSHTEKASIDSEESSDKVKLLQSKIDALEIALKEALKK